MLILKDIFVDTLSQIILFGLTLVIGTIVSMAVAQWNKFIKDKGLLAKLEVSHALQIDVENKLVAGMRYLAEQELKRKKIDPLFKFPAEDKLKIVADYAVPLIGEENLRKLGMDIEKEIEQVLNKVRPDTINFPTIQ